jgi:tetratricopeptide (TPR) repeat protein
MAIEGRLEEVGLADICQLLSMGRKTGCLTVTDRSNFGYVYFHGGRVTFATVLNRPDRLGEVLVRSGVIAREDLTAAMEEQRKAPGHRLGQILLDQQKLTQEQLRQFVSVQIQEAVFHLFGWESGEFHFEPGRRPDADESLLVSLNAESLLLEGARRVDELSVIEKKIPSTDLIFRASEREGKRKEEIELTPEQQAVLPLLDGMRTVDDVVLDSGIVEFEVMKAIYGLVQAGLARTEGDRRDAPATGPESAARTLDLADAFYRAGMLEDAEVHYRAVLETEPTEAHARGRLAVIALRTHRPAEALGHLDAQPESDAGSVPTLRNRALALELLGRNEDALEALAKAEELDPDDRQVTLARGILLLKSGKAADATETFRRYRQASLSEKSPSAMYFAYAILAAAAAGDAPQAIQIGREGLTLYPASCPVLVNLGLVLERAGEVDAAEALYLRAVQRSAPPPQAHKNLGDLAYKRGDGAGARAHYERAVKLNPALGDDTYLKLGELAYKDGDKSEARTLWQKALELNPRNEVVRTNLALVAEGGGG